MYHTKDDKRSIYTSTLLYEALMMNLKTTPFDEISVSNLVRKAGVSRSTFYRTFDNIADILAWRCDSLFKEMASVFDKQRTRSKSSFLVFGIHFWQERWECIDAIIKIGRLDLVYDVLERNIEHISFSSTKAEDMSDAERSYFLTMRAALFVSILKTWLDRGRVDDAETLADILKRRIMEVSFEFLLD